MKKKNIINENYLENIPLRNDKYKWTKDAKGIVTLEIPNRGVFNRIAQKLFKRPPITYVHLDEMGSFIFPLMDGEKSILDLGKYVEENFGEKAHPLYERLAKYCQILNSYGFIAFKNKD